MTHNGDDLYDNDVYIRKVDCHQQLRLSLILNVVTLSFTHKLLKIYLSKIRKSKFI